MKTVVKSVVKRLNKLPEGKYSPEFYTPSVVRSYLFASYCYPVGFISHFSFMVIFAFIGIMELALFNIISISLWGTAIILHRKGFFWLGYLLVAVELILHAAICTAIIGWSAGFQYYLLQVPVAVFLVHWKTTIKALIAFIFSCAYMAINYYATVSSPYVIINSLYTAAFNYGNILSTCFGLAVIGYVYYNATINSEEKLEKEHKHTNEALKERNILLDRLNQELADAAEYVKNILPQPITDGVIRTNWLFIPSTSLGGDAFGYHKVDDNHFAVYLIDVSGHGVGAALLSASVINVLRSQSLPKCNFKAPDQVLQTLNLTFPSDTNKDMFLSIWYGVYNQKSRELIFSSAGHPPAILCNRKSSADCKIDLLKTPNFVVGAVEETTYSTNKCTVEEGNALYIFSDGVYEVEKADGSMWSLSEFAEYIRRVEPENSSVLGRLYEYVKKIRKSDCFEDDFTILEVAFT